MKRGFGWAVVSSLVCLLPWTGCSGERRDFGNQATAGASGDAGTQSGAGNSGRGGRSSTAGGSSKAGDSSDMAGTSNGGQAGDSSDGTAGSSVAGQSENDGSSPTAGSGGGTPVGECAAGKSEACGDCGTRTCDATTLKWGACSGDGHQQACWKTAAGVALPGTMPAAPKGSCHAGQQTCQANAAWSACTGAVAPAAADDCSVAGNDANCDGTANGGCNCVSNDTRTCGKDTGNCQTGTQTCTNQVWGACVGEIKEAANDSCATTGDDANCNGVANEGCLCTPGNVATACNDNVACTDDGCNNGVCTHSVSAGYCLIGTSCVAHNTAESGNACRYCDATINKIAWSNSSPSTKCDDGLWCNGDDTCNGGACTHQFTGNRCTASGACALSVCDEARDSCFKPTTASCKTATEKQCASTTACAADVQSRTSTQYCSGTTVDCTGSTTYSAWAPSTDCTADQTCNGSSFTCQNTLGCGSTWCNGTASGSQCWTLNTDLLGRDAAIAACANLTAGGMMGWALPTIYEYLTIDQGCDGTTGSINGSTSTCTMGADLNQGAQSCLACPDGMGTGDKGCYWFPGMGTCNNTVWGYWSQSKTNFGPLGYGPKSNSVVFWPGDPNTVQYAYRCTRKKP